MTLQLTSEAPPAWGEWIEAFPGRTLYHTPHWIRAICAAYPEYVPRFLVDEEHQVLIPYVIFSKKGLRQILSLPFGTFGGPIYAPQTEDEVLRRALRGFKKKLRGLQVLRYQLAVVNPEPRLQRLLGEVFGEPQLQQFSTYVVPLEKGFDWIWNTGYENDVRRCVRKAEKSGVTLAEETTLQGAEVLFELYRLQTKTWRIKGHSAEALWQVAQELGSQARIWVTRREGRPLTAVLTLYDPGREVRPWVSGANEESRGVKAYHYMMNCIMKHGCDEGYALWDWGGSVGRSSVESFKQSMAGQPVPVIQVFKEAGWYSRLRGISSQRQSS